ncbi:MAG: maltose alpha-D-glucosyltransferase / alpha-amylase, partial [Verrucomicrobiota bacterium]
HYEAINVENQQKNLSSLLWWTRRVIAMRKNFRAFSRGSLEFLFPENNKVLAFLRRHEDETILVVVNLSRFAQAAELDLGRFAGCALMEMFSQNYFPPIGKSPYVITLGPHSHYWFVLRSETAASVASKERKISMLAPAPNVAALLDNGQRAAIEREVLPGYIRNCRWFGAKARTLRQMRIVEEIPVGGEGAAIWFVEVSYLEGATEVYALPVQIARDDAARALERSAPQSIIARLHGDGDTVLHDAVYDESFRKALFKLMTGAQSAPGLNGSVTGLTSSAFPAESKARTPASQVLSAEQSNSSMLFKNKFFLKLYRKLEDGVNPDVEVTRFLTERAKFSNVPAFLGAIEYRRPKTEPTVVCLLQSAIANEGDAWTLTLDAVGRFYERVLTRKADLQNQSTPPGPLLEELIGGIYPEKAKLIGQRTGELHRALALSVEERGFAPEKFNAMAQRSVYQNMRASLRRAFGLLEKKLPTLPDAFREEAAQVLAAEKQILAQEQRLLDRRVNATKIRIHGDYHLGQVLYTGKDFIILDFEGEPARPLSERKLKRSALRDVAGMMRSFQYAAYSALWQPAMRAEDAPFLERWADLWYRQMSSVFLHSYLAAADGADFIPPDENDFQVLLEAYLLDKAVYEIGYELNNRPAWVVIPIRGIKHILGAS